MENINDTSRRDGNRPEKGNQERMISCMLADDLEELFRNTPEEGYGWMDSQAALVEACHMAWTTGRLHDAMGRNTGFHHIVRMACERLHVRMPANPSAVVYKARQRKGVRVGQLLGRYLILQGQGIRDPFRFCVRRRRHGKRQQEPPKAQ